MSMIVVDISDSKLVFIFHFALQSHLKCTMEALCVTEMT